MAASLDQTAVASLGAALDALREKVKVDSDFADAKLRFIRDGRRASWSWSRIGKALGVSANAVRRYWNDHRQRADRLPDA